MSQNLRDIDKRLLDAIRLNDAVSVAAALGEGAGVNFRSWNNRTPLHYAVTQAGAEIVKLLLAAKADPNLDDDTGMSPLHEAVVHKKFDVADVLLAGGANINFQFGKGPAVIHSAFFQDLRDDETVRSEYMVRRGADLSVTMQRGMGEWTVYEIAREQAYKFPYAEVILGAMIGTERNMKREKEQAEQAEIDAAEAAVAKEAQSGIAAVNRTAINNRRRYKL